MRKWWWKEERDMPEGKVIAGSDFGTAIHGVNERWRRADDRGNFPAGIELYPAGWNKGLDAADSALVKMLHDKAVEQGILVRRKGRKPEEWMNTPIIVDDDVVQLTGKLDCEDEEGFEDDKSTKAAKWAKDEEGLASDAAMLFYAVEWCRRHGEAIKVRMRYNYFLKDPSQPKTWPVEALVTREVVDHFKENDLLPTVRAMVAVAKQKLPDEAWEQVAGPTTQDACRAFGGCPYATICGRVEQPAQYRARIARVLSNRQAQEQPMGVFSKAGQTPASPAAPAQQQAPAPAASAVVQTTVAPPAVVAAKPSGIFAKKNATPAATPVTQAPVAPAAAPVAPPSAPTQVQLAKPELPAKTSAPVPGAAPWAHPDCRSCKGTGMHPTEKRPCKGCRSIRMVQKLLTDESYDISYAADGSLQFALKAGLVAPAPVGTVTRGEMPAIAPVAAPVQAPTPTVTEPVVKEKKAPRGKKAAEVAADVQAPAAPNPAVAADVKVEHVEPLVVPDLPFILAINTAPEKVAGLRVASVADVFAEAASAVGEALGKNFWEVNSFERRDLLSKLAAGIAGNLRGYLVVGSSGAKGSDIESLLQALKPFATMVLIGTN